MNRTKRKGAAIRDVISRYHEAGLKEPEFRVTDGFVTVNRRKAREETPEVTPIVRLCRLAKPECSVSIGRVSTLRRVARAVAGEVAREVTGELRCLLTGPRTGVGQNDSTPCPEESAAEIPTKTERPRGAETRQTCFSSIIGESGE